MTKITFWQDLRYLALYPSLMVFGAAYAVLFYVRWRTSRCAGDRWSVRMGIALVVWGFSGFLALAIASRTGFSVLTTTIFTMGALAPAVVLIWGVLRLGLESWRR